MLKKKKKSLALSLSLIFSNSNVPRKALTSHIILLPFTHDPSLIIENFGDSWGKISNTFIWIKRKKLLVRKAHKGNLIAKWNGFNSLPCLKKENALTIR